ncbi:uncharacterized protein LOC134243209 [Saccostrea cucullata]|uniref:uncharacterized protein LOC134243209 n=1 Tax=Saccostrea cuccullata TaxID=36930 RepID=UPI002ED1ADA5
MTARKMRKKSDYQHLRSFKEEVEVLRNLHPEADLIKDDEMLNSGLREWRREAELALNINEGHLGGLMKEALSVACLSKRCFLWAMSIMEAYKEWKLKRQTNNKVNRMLFVQLPGMKNEEVLFNLLRQFRGGELTKNEFNEKMKEQKSLAVPSNKRRPTKGDPGPLKKKIADLESRNSMLQKQVIDLKKKLMETTKTDAVDVYAFESDDASDDIEVAAVLPPLQENREESSSEGDSDDSLSVLIPTINYMRTPALVTSNAKDDHTVIGDDDDDDDDDDDEGAESNEEALLQTFVDLEEDTTTEFSELKAGDLVLAKDEDEWFKATVIVCEAQKYKVHYFGYGAHFDKWVSKEEVKLYCFAVGEKLKARWEDGFFYKGEVQSVNGREVTVLFDDGDVGKATCLKFC